MTKPLCYAQTIKIWGKIVLLNKKFDAGKPGYIHILVLFQYCLNKSCLFLELMYLMMQQYYFYDKTIPVSRDFPEPMLMCAAKGCNLKSEAKIKFKRKIIKLQLYLE